MSELSQSGIAVRGNCHDATVHTSHSLGQTGVPLFRSPCVRDGVIVWIIVQINVDDFAVDRIISFPRQKYHQADLQTKLVVEFGILVVARDIHGLGGGNRR
jgi:hypothetical protein